MADRENDRRTAAHRAQGGKPIRVACVGGGQLGRMMALEAPRLNVTLSLIDPAGHDSPAAQVVPSHCIRQGSLRDAAALQQWAQEELAAAAEDENPMVITVEIEHIDTEALYQMEQQGFQVQPSSRVLSLIQDKLRQKEHLAGKHGLPCASFMAVSTVQQLRQQVAPQLGLPLMLKSRRDGYDGRGNAPLHDLQDESIQAALEKLGFTLPEFVANNFGALDLGDVIYAEGWVHFSCEIAVMVVRSSLASSQDDSSSDTTATTRCYPAVTAIQQDSICRVVLAPARNLSDQLRREAEQLAIRAVDSLGPGASGIFGVEMFVTQGTSTDPHPRILLNEIAPRPHNTGHFTQDACYTSQFENHLRAITGLPLGSTDMMVPCAAMLNVLGAQTETDQNPNSGMPKTWETCQAALAMPHASVHWYGKTSCRPGRKMGHINIVGHTTQKVDEALSKLLALENLPLSILNTGNSSHPASAAISSTTPGQVGAVPAAVAGPSSPLVAVVMGSHSDLPTMQQAVVVLQEFGIPYLVDIVSAHRTPDKMVAFGRSAADKGIQVIIAGAGGAAHLPGMVAAVTPLPVIGVPVKTSTLSGVDSLYSIVQMPKGIPVATVAIGNATNAGLLAVRILAATRPDLLQAMEQYQVRMKEAVDATSTRLLELGSDAYLQQMESKHESVNV